MSRSVPPPPRLPDAHVWPEPGQLRGDAARVEHDTMGDVLVPRDAYWGAQTERSRTNFRIGLGPNGSAGQRFGRPVVRAFGLVKASVAEANLAVGWLDERLAGAIVHAADEVAEGALDAHFPLSVWQTGSGTQSNMNANEVVANRAAEILGQARGSGAVHPNDHVNLGQSSNDVFPTVMHVALAEALGSHLVPAAERLRAALAAKAEAFAHLVKIGRTHLMDATPLTLGQELSGHAAQIAAAAQEVLRARDGLLPLALGGTAVGTGLNAHPEMAERAVAKLAARAGIAFTCAENRFAALAAHDAVVLASAATRQLAVACFKVASDVRLLGSGPRAGFGELVLPANEPGSSIMPGKVNPTQAEALTMVVTRVFGNDATVAFAGTQGHLELNVFKPVMLHAALESAVLLGDACTSFAERCIEGLEADERRIGQHLERSLMLVTALAPVVGYEAAARIAKQAHADGSTLREAALATGLVDGPTFDDAVRPEAMLAPAARPPKKGGSGG